MWTCEKCGAENEGYVCTECGAAYEEERTEKMPSGHKSYTVLIAALAVLILALLVLLVVLFTMNKEEKTAPVQVVVTTAVPTETANISAYDEKTEGNIPESPAWITETAEITGVAAMNDASTYSRRNIHLTNVKEYIDQTICPIYNMIADPDNVLPSSAENGIIKEYADETITGLPGEIVVCVTYPAGTNGNHYSRKYYFDPSTNEFIFAFLFDGSKEEHRLYFYKDSLIHHKVRQNGGEDVATDNPTEEYLLTMAEEAIREAYAGR